MAKVNVYGELNCAEVDGKLARTDQIYDYAKGKYQSEINDSVSAATQSEIQEAIQQLETTLEDLQEAEASAVSDAQAAIGESKEDALEEIAQAIENLEVHYDIETDKGAVKDVQLKDGQGNKLMPITNYDYDVSAMNPTAGPNMDGKFESLSALLLDNNLDTLIPNSVRKGGMTIKYVQIADNKYVQYFLTKDEWSAYAKDWEKINIIENLYGSKANLSAVTNSGFIMANHNIGSNGNWRYGSIPVPSGSKTIAFNDLPSAQYSHVVFSYFVNENNEFIGENIVGTSYLGAGVVTINIPNGAVALMFSGATSALSGYDIRFYFIVNQVSKNTEDIAQLQGNVQQNTEDIAELKDAIEANNITILIPDIIYAIVGTELNIWNDAVSLSIDNGLYSPRNYVVEWISNKGIVTSRCFRFNPTTNDVGTHTCTCSIFTTNTHNLIATKTFSIKVVAKNALNTLKRIVHFGDSLGSSTAGQLYGNFNNPDKFTGVAPMMLGTRGSNPNYHFEAVGGYTWRDYATQGNNQYRIQVTGVSSVNVGAVYSYNNVEYNIREVNITGGNGNLLLERNYGIAGSIDGVTSGTITRTSGSGDSSISFTNCTREPNNPVWDETLNDGNGGLSFSKYRERLGLMPSEKIDAATFQFGVNESLGNPNINTILNNYIIPLYNAFIADNPNGKFIVGMTTSAGNDVNGAGANYGAGRNTWNYLKNTYEFRKMYLESLQGLYPNLIIAPSQLEVDRYYGYAFHSRQISQRTTTTEQYHNNFVHPGDDGYGQIADALFATYIGVLTE